MAMGITLLPIFYLMGIDWKLQKARRLELGGSFVLSWEPFFWNYLITRYWGIRVTRSMMRVCIPTLQLGVHSAISIPCHAAAYARAGTAVVGATVTWVRWHALQIGKKFFIA